MKHEKIIKREDGSRVSVMVILTTDPYREKFNYSVDVFKCAPKKRSFYNVINRDDYSYRALSMEDREKFKEQEILKHITPEELLQAKRECWKLLEPKS